MIAQLCERPLAKPIVNYTSGHASQIPSGWLEKYHAILQCTYGWDFPRRAHMQVGGFDMRLTAYHYPTFHAKNMQTLNLYSPISP